MASALLGRLLIAASCLSLAPSALGQVNAAGPGTMDAAPGSLAPNQGALMCVAAVNSDATLAGGAPYVATVTTLGTGNYEVVFKGACGGNISAARGWARWVQVDTLTAGSITNVACTTADRAGNPAGVFVRCFDGSGTAANTSFFLFVAR
ncbi:MAG TPA: hypothetical protein VLI72_14560 [Methylibium sp.]|nr:hypothetical protein [Methylibium sp.]